MIRTLTIHNIALIEHITVEFHKGMTVLSGETGAGKSIIVDAVALILGGRADRELIRTGCDRASVEAEFETEKTEGLKDVLEREQIEWDGHSLIVYRDISQTGRNVCRINGVMVSATVLKEVTAWLLNLHGQSEHQFLADEDKHLEYLDLMGSEEHREKMEQVREAYQSFIVNHRAYAKLVKMNEDRERRIDILRHELDELHRAVLLVSCRILASGVVSLLVLGLSCFRDLCVDVRAQLLIRHALHFHSPVVNFPLVGCPPAIPLSHCSCPPHLVPGYYALHRTLSGTRDT